MNARQRRTLSSIFARPVPANIRWSQVESLFVALGATVNEGRGSRVRVELNGVDAIFHRPHPKPETDRGALVSIRRFLEQAGVKP